MLFNQNARKLLFLVLTVSTSLWGMEPWHRQVTDYASRYKKEIAAGVGAAALAGAAYYYGKQQGQSDTYSVSIPAQTYSIGTPIGNFSIQTPKTEFSVPKTSTKGFGSNVIVGNTGSISVGNPASYKFNEIQKENIAIADGAIIRIENHVGDIDSESYDGDELKLIAKKRAETEKDLKRLKIEIAVRAKNVLIKTTYENPQEVMRGLIDYKILVPRNKSISQELVTSVGHAYVKNVQGNLLAQSSTGDIKAEQVGGNAQLISSVGKISGASIQGTVIAQTSTGDVTIVQDTINTDLTAKTNVGFVTIIANAINAIVKANTSVGNISSNFKLSSPVQKKSFVGRSLDAHVGQESNAVINLSTSTGDIVLKKKDLTSRL